MSIEQTLEYTFKDKNLLQEALNHPSFKDGMFEKLEFLGDRVLGLVMAEILYKTDNKIKSIAGKFSNLVSADILSVIAKSWKVEEYLNHEIDIILSNKVLADVCESIIGAVYLDGGYFSAYELVSKFWKSLIESNDFIDPKMHLQEISQSKKLGVPIYSLINTSGPAHLPEYEIRVEISNLGSGIGKGKSKQEASKNAAMDLLKTIIKSA
jgi:ribonuclease-3